MLHSNNKDFVKNILTIIFDCKNKLKGKNKCAHQWGTVMYEDKTPSDLYLCIYCLKKKINE